MTENDTCDTFKSRNDSTITLLLCKEELKMTQNTQKHLQLFTQWRQNNSKEGGFNRGVLITGSKTPEQI